MNGLPLPSGVRVRVRGTPNAHPSPSQRLSEPAATLIPPHQRLCRNWGNGEKRHAELVSASNNINGL